MTLIEKCNKAIREARDGKYIITDKETGKSYKYGENPFMDTQCENAVFIDLFPECVEDISDFHGFDRNKYILEHYNYYGHREML